MNRRTFIRAGAALFGLVPVAIGAQSDRPRRIGFIGNGQQMALRDQLEALGRGLHALGWIEGRTATIDARWTEGSPDRLRAIVAEFVASKVDVIVVSGTPAIRAAKAATGTLPVVFVVLANPVSTGLVASLGRPGGNLTGMASQFEELIAKQVEILKEALPGLARIALLYHVETAPAVLAAAESAARTLGLATQTLRVTAMAELENAFALARGTNVGAIHVMPSPYFGANHVHLVELAARYRLPAFYELALYVRQGGLLSYGPSINGMFERAASFVDRILKGASPGDLAIERPSKFELAVNLRTAAALRLDLPKSVLQRADEVIR